MVTPPKKSRCQVDFCQNHLRKLPGPHHALSFNHPILFILRGTTSKTRLSQDQLQGHRAPLGLHPGTESAPEPIPLRTCLGCETRATNPSLAPLDETQSSQRPTDPPRVQ